MKNVFFGKRDAVLLLSVSVAALLLFLIFLLIPKDGKYAVVRSDGEIAAKLPLNENTTYTSSYHEKTTLEEGDHVIASLKKTNGKWVISNGLYEVDSDDYQTLSVKPCDKSPDNQSIILKYFINSDGMMNKFSSKNNGNTIYYQNKKIYDARWNMKKYLTIEEIRNSEKLKQMDHKTSLVENIEEKTTVKTRKLIMFVVDVLAVVMIVGLLKKRKKI